MRLLIIAMTTAGLTALAAPASACPPVEACLTQLPSTISPTVVDADAKVEPIEAIREAAAPRLLPGEIEMPWIWAALRARVYSRMPTYEERNEVKIVLSPVVVTSIDDTIPGVGVSGLF